MATILYYIFLKPLSLLPPWLLYRISDLLFFVLYYGGLYRKKLVFKQISDSFPEKNKKEVQLITKKFFAHFCDLIVESVMIFSISEKEALRRCAITSNAVFNDLFSKNKNIIIAGGHYNNWEMLAVAVDAQIPHQTVALYTPLYNKSLDKIMRESRSKYGLELYPKKHSFKIFDAKRDKPFAAIFGADQCPTKSKSVYWTQFLGQETAVAFGTEKYAIQHDCAVLFGRILKVSRGVYKMDFELISENPKEEPYGAITNKHVALLEADIRHEPQYWLWTHRRWKMKKVAATQ